jgi:hypothetical protein
MPAGLIVWLCLVASAQNARAFDGNDPAAIGAAYTTHIVLHEMGHQVVAEDVGATSPKMKFFAERSGTIYPGLSSCKKIPEESRLPYAVGGERMAGFTFEYAPQSYRRRPTTYKKALMFFSCTDFLIYTFLANYVNPDDGMYDPNLIREETGCSKELLLSLVMAKSLLNTYRVMNPDARLAPMIWVDKHSAAFVLRLSF